MAGTSTTVSTKVRNGSGRTNGMNCSDSQENSVIIG